MKDVSVLIANGINVEKSLEIFGDMETYDEILVTFLEEINGKLEKLKGYKETADMANYAILVHSLKSDSRYFGFTTLAEIAYKHELESKENNIYFVTENYSKLEKETKRIINIIKLYFGEDIQEKGSESKTIVKEKMILVVDDSNTIKNYIKNIFNNEYEVLVASDGSEAISVIERNIHLNGILLDLNMPKVDGFQVLDYFASNHLFSKIPVAIITGEDTKQNIERLSNYSIVGILRKPFNERDVKLIIEKMNKEF